LPILCVNFTQNVTARNTTEEDTNLLYKEKPPKTSILDNKEKVDGITIGEIIDDDEVLGEKLDQSIFLSFL